jgi:hypothetical protein
VTPAPPDPRLPYRLRDCDACGAVSVARCTAPPSSSCSSCGAPVVEVEVAQVAGLARHVRMAYDCGREDEREAS